MPAEASALDRRRNAYRDDLAAETLRGKVSASAFSKGEVRWIIDAAVPLRSTPGRHASWTTEALFGEHATVYDEQDGWAWVQLSADAYVGYLPTGALSATVRTPTHRVRALGSWLYPEPDFKSPPSLALSMNSSLCVSEVGAAFARLADGRFVPTAHIASQDQFEPDFVSVAEAFLGVPYVWGGKTRLGVDCSGLVQVAMQAAGLICPRDSDMQMSELGSALETNRQLDCLRRGDLVFWAGHVGIMLDAVRLLHANAHHMAVAVEPLGGAVDRIARTGSNVTAVKRTRT